MKKYLVRIEAGAGVASFTTIHGDIVTRPFTIAGNLWNYQTPWTAARRLETLAQSWEKHGHTVRRVYGTIYDIPTAGDADNVAATLNDFK